MLILESFWVCFRHWVRLWYYRTKIKGMTKEEILKWADEHPYAKKLLGLRGYSELLLGEVIALSLFHSNADVDIYAIRE